MKFFKNIKKWRIVEPILLGSLANIIINYVFDPFNPDFELKEFLVACIFAIPVTEINRKIDTSLEKKMNTEMLKHEKNKLIIGYVVGFLIFMIIIPSLIYFISQIEIDFFKIPITDLIAFRLIIAGILFIVGMIFTVWSNIDLFKIGKGGPTDVFNIEISPRSKKLVVTGPYAFSRNPMVFGVNSIYFAIAIFINSLASLIFCALFLFVIIFYLKLTEEKRLLKDFGIEYRNYKQRVSMIIPFPKKKISD